MLYHIDLSSYYLSATFSMGSGLTCDIPCELCVCITGLGGVAVSVRVIVWGFGRAFYHIGLRTYDVALDLYIVI